MLKSDETEKGCVYFFKHLGLTPIKIGYSSSPSPIKRFDSFRTYAPFGAEIVGFIQTDSAKELESKLHAKFAASRLEGEWFDIDIDVVESVISHYSTISQNEQRNRFMVAYAKSLENQKTEKEAVYSRGDLGSNEEISRVLRGEFSMFRKLYTENPDLNKTDAALNLNVSRVTIYRWVRIIKSKQN